MLGAAWLAASRVALADGAIVTTDADISAGEGSPRGRTIVDALAPPMSLWDPAPLPSLPRLPDQALDFPPFGPSGDGDHDLVVVSGTTASLSAGVHEFATLAVQANAVLECLGPVTIRVAGPVLIHGVVTSMADGASITFVCGSDFSMGTGSTGSVASIETLGSGAPVTIDAAGPVSCDAAKGSRIAATGTVTLLQRATYASLLLRRTDVSSAAGDIDIRSASGVTLSVLALQAGGDIEMSAFNGRTEVSNAEITTPDAFRVQSRYQISFTDVSATCAGPVDVSAIYDRILLMRSTVETVAGSSADLAVRSSDQITLSRSTLRHRGAGTLDLRGSSVVLEYPQFSGASHVLHEGEGDVRIAVSGMVIAYGTSSVVASLGHVLMHASHVEANGDTLFSAVAGTLEFDLGRSMRLRASTTGGPEGRPDIEAGTIRITSRQDEVSLSVDRAEAGQGGLAVRTAGGVVLRGKFTSLGPLTILDPIAKVDLAGADLSTTATSGHASSPVVVQALAIRGGIDATGARIRSGDATAGPSGDVVLAAHEQWWPGASCSTCDIEDGAIPGWVEAFALGAHAVRLSWIPRDLGSTGYLVERAAADGPFEPVATLGADDVVFVDEGLAPDTEYGYRISVLTGVLTSSPTPRVAALTKPNIGIRVLRADVVDKPSLRTDTVAISLKLRFPERPAGETFDPTAGQIRIVVGDAFKVTVPANDARWTHSGGVYEWAGPVGYDGDATVRVVPATGRLDVRAKGIGVVQPDADRSFIRVSLGADAGTKPLRKRARR